VGKINIPEVIARKAEYLDFDYSWLLRLLLCEISNNKCDGKCGNCILADQNNKQFIGWIKRNIDK